MIACDTLVQVSATVIVGSLFLVSLRQAMGLRMSGSFLTKMVFLVFAPFTATAFLATLGQIEAANATDAVGFLALFIVLFLFANETNVEENRIR